MFVYKGTTRRRLRLDYLQFDFIFTVIDKQTERNQWVAWWIGGSMDEWVGKCAPKRHFPAVRKINQNRFKSTTSVADLPACVCV